MGRWKLKELLDQHGITPYRLSAEMKGSLSQTTIYEITQGKTRRLDLDTLDKLASTLKRLTGEDVDANALIEVDA